MARLLIPLVFGLAVFVPLMTYITQVVQGKTLTLWQQYANFITVGSDMTGRLGTFTPAHLWFITYLFIFALLSLPLFRLLQRLGSQGFMRGLAGFLDKPMALLLPGVLLLGVVLEVLRQTGQPVTAAGALGRMLKGVARDFNRWVWVLALLGMGYRLLNRGSRVLDYLAESSYPVYNMHFVVLTAVTYVVVPLQAVVVVKYLLIVAATFGITYLAYEVARRVAPLRVLLGMKARGQQPQTVTGKEMARA